MNNKDNILKLKIMKLDKKDYCDSCSYKTKNLVGLYWKGQLWSYSCKDIISCVKRKNNE